MTVLDQNSPEILMQRTNQLHGFYNGTTSNSLFCPLLEILPIIIVVKTVLRDTHFWKLA